MSYTLLRYLIISRDSWRLGTDPGPTLPGLKIKVSKLLLGYRPLEYMVSIIERYIQQESRVQLYTALSV